MTPQQAADEQRKDQCRDRHVQPVALHTPDLCVVVTEDQEVCRRVSDMRKECGSPGEDDGRRGEHPNPEESPDELLDAVIAPHWLGDFSSRLANNVVAMIRAINA